MLLDVLTQFCADTGLDIDQKRTIALQFLSRGAKELHKKMECNRLLREVTLAVPPNKVVTLPSSIGELRGMRMHTNELPFDLHSLAQPRYVTSTLGYKYKNWRDIGISPVLQYPSTDSQIYLSSVAIETVPAKINILGQTTNSAELEEVLIMSGNIVNTQNVFLAAGIANIASMSQRVYDIHVKDANGNEIATLLNNQKQTRYKIVDVSQVFWTTDTNDGMSLIDVLYKVPSTELWRDSDCFFTGGDEYDEAWYNMAMHLFYRPIENKTAEAQTYLADALTVVEAAKESSESGILKKLQFGRNKFYSLFKRYRYYPGSVTNVDHNLQ